jgi:hypothetical protein
MTDKVAGQHENGVKVLYIAGWGRSGSTILDNILGQLDGFYSVGELRYIWERGFIEDRLCGDGVPFHESDFWRSILDEAFGGFDKIDPSRMAKLQNNCISIRRLPLVIATGRLFLARPAPTDYLETISRLYKAVRHVTGCRVIVDSSKYPLYAHLLSLVTSIDLHILHLVRDPRGVAYSWLRKKAQPDKGEGQLLSRHNPIKSSLQWGLLNSAASRLQWRLPGRYMLLRYEDFMKNPEEAVRRVAALVGEKPDRLPFVGERVVTLGTSQAFSGNPSRFRTGEVELQLDDEWEERMASRHRLLVAGLTWPLLAKYGYSRADRE